MIRVYTVYTEVGYSPPPIYYIGGGEYPTSVYPVYTHIRKYSHLGTFSFGYHVNT